MTTEDYENYMKRALKAIIEAVPKGRVHHSLPIVMQARRIYINEHAILGDTTHNAKLYSIWLEACILLGVSRLYINDEAKFKELTQRTLAGEY